MKDLSVVNINSEERVAECLDSFQPVTPGMYWRCTKTMTTENRYEIPEGKVLLLLETKIVDGDIHSVDLNFNPLDGEGTYTILLEDLYKHFLPEYEHEKIRAAEMQSIHNEVSNLQKELMDIQSNPALLMESIKDDPELDRSVGLPQLAFDGNTSVETALPDIANKVAVIQKQVKNQAILAKAQTNLIMEKTDVLQKTISKLVPFYKEKAAASLAACSNTIKAANKLMEGLKTLELYTGKDVEVKMLSDGEEADPSEPLTLFQRKLYMDEEHLVHVAEGGADWQDFDSFAKALSVDVALLDRLIPTTRGVVSMAFRRNHKNYGDDPFLNKYHNDQNRISFLIVRNGRKVYQVYSELSTRETDRLFPTYTETGSPFRGFRGEEITMESIRFADAWQAHERIALHYKRLLILLWGLHDRLGLFGSFEMLNGAPAVFTDASVQEKIFRFVYDDEHGGLLGDGRPRFQEWFQEKNKYLQSGSRVACYWDELLGPDTSPSCVHIYRNGEFSIKCKPDTPGDVCVAAKEGKHIVVRVPVSGAPVSYKTNKEKLSFNATIKLTAYKGTSGYLCLDMVTAEELDYYINSRLDRMYYLHYIPLFIAARETLKTDERHNAEMAKDLNAALQSGGIKVAEAEAAQYINEAIRSWRAANRGKSVPQKADDDYAACFHGLLDHLYVTLGQGRDRVKQAEDLCAQEGRTPLRLVVTGKNRLSLYATAVREEEGNLLFPHPWVMRIDLEGRKTKLGVINRKWELLTKFDATKSVLHEWPESRFWEGKELPDGAQYSYDDLKNVRTYIDRACENIATYFRTMGDTEFDLYLDRLAMVTKEMSGKYIQHPDVLIPVGLIKQVDDRYYHNDHTKTLDCVIYLSAYMPSLLYHYATDTQKAEIVRYVTRLYAHPERGLRNFCEPKIGFLVSRFIRPIQETFIGDKHGEWISKQTFKNRLAGTEKERWMPFDSLRDGEPREPKYNPPVEIILMSDLDKVFDTAKSLFDAMGGPTIEDGKCTK